jgi:hypothetical protein
MARPSRRWVPTPPMPLDQVEAASHGRAPTSSTRSSTFHRSCLVAWLAGSHRPVRGTPAYRFLAASRAARRHRQLGALSRWLHTLSSDEPARSALTMCAFRACGHARSVHPRQRPNCDSYSYYHRGVRTASSILHANGLLWRRCDRCRRGARHCTEPEWLGMDVRLLRCGCYFGRGRREGTDSGPKDPGKAERDEHSDVSPLLGQRGRGPVGLPQFRRVELRAFLRNSTARSR